MYSSPYGYGYNSGFSALQTTSVFSAVGLIVGIIAAIVLFAVFLKKKNEGKFTGFAGWMYDFLNFQKLSVEAILKILYIVIAVWITFTAFGLIASAGFLAFIFTLVLGNILIRVGFEFSMIAIKICKNIIEINKKMTIINKKVSKDEVDEPVADANAEKNADAVANAEENATEDVAAKASEANISETDNNKKTCPNCGAEVETSYAFCGKCGTKL